MGKEASSTPNELREISDEDESVVSSICPRQTNQLSDQSLKSWIDPVQIHSWTDLSKCMQFIAKNGCSKNRRRISMRRTLDRISTTATPEQLIHILNGYADLYKLVLYFIQINDNVPVKKNDIRTFGGTSSHIKQEKRHRNFAFIMYNSQNSLFTSLYATHTDGRPQTCFATDDERITDDISALFDRWNDEMSQRSAQEIDHIDDNNDATKDAEGSQNADSLDALLPPESIAENEAVLTTSEIYENDVQHISQILAQSDSPANSGKIIGNSKDTMATHPHSTPDPILTVKNVQQHLDYIEDLLNQARRLRGEVDDTPSMETDDRQLASNEALKERELMSHNGMINMAKSKTGHAKKHVSSSNNNRSHTRMCLSQSTTQTAPMTATHDQSISSPVQVTDSPNVTKQPKSHRRVRMLKDLANKRCPLVQGKNGERSYPEIKVTGDGDEGSHIRVRAVTENKHSHPCTTVAPANAFVNWTMMQGDNERTCLQCNPDSFDPAIECVYLPVMPDERQKRRKEIKIYLFNWKQYGPTIKEVIERENLRLCRLEFHWCMRLSLGQYELVSQPFYTTVIEQVDGDVTIDPDKIEPKELCELGGEKIIVPLSVICRKKDFLIECNGDELPNKKFSMERKKLSIISPRQDEGIDELHLTIKRVEYFENTSVRTENSLYDEYLPYVPHGQDRHTCSHCS